MLVLNVGSLKYTTELPMNEMGTVLQSRDWATVESRFNYGWVFSVHYAAMHLLPNLESTNTMKIKTRSFILTGLCLVLVAMWSGPADAHKECCEVRWVLCTAPVSSTCNQCVSCSGYYYGAANNTKECYAVENGYDECRIYNGTGGWCYYWYNCGSIPEEDCPEGGPLCQWDDYTYGGSVQTGHGLVGACTH